MANPGIVRFNNARGDVNTGANPSDTRIDVPVSGSIVPLILVLNGTGAKTLKYKADLPPGARFRVTNATFRASEISGTPLIAVGTVNNATALVASIAATTNLGNLTVKTASQNFAADSMIIATLTLASATGVCRAGVLTLYGHNSAPAAIMATRTTTYF
jgi:acyl CoA:acetate/3-ketoacid CoA transferase alpha subunit